MLTHSKTFSSYSVDEIARVKDFYEHKLGLNVSVDPMGILKLNMADGSEVVIYPKGEDHQPAGFTVLNFRVDDIDKTVDRLMAEDIQCEQYEGELKTDEKGILRGNGPQIAWFKDPAGNILSVIESDT